MKITVLGCWGVGTVGETTAFLVDMANATFLIDTGLSPARQMAQLNRVLPEVSHIFITHVHADHLQGFPYALFVRGVQERSYGQVLPMKVVSHSQGVSTAKQLCQLLYPERPLNAEWIELKSGDSLRIADGLTVRTLAVDHTVSTFAYRFDSSSESLTISGDTLPNDSLIEFAKGSKVLIQETFGTEKDFGSVSAQLKHTLASQAGQIAKRASVENLILYHMHIPYAKKEKQDELLAELQLYYRGNVVFPHDLQVLEF